MPPPPPFEAVSPKSYTAKVKNLLTGLAPTNEELQAVTADPTALKGLINQWMARPEYRSKMLAFFRNAFQQAQVDAASLRDRLGGTALFTNGPTLPRMLVNIQESFPRTAWEMVEGGKPWNNVVTTRRFMMTSALASFLAYLDDRYVDDAGRIGSRLLKANPGLTVTGTSVAVPLAETVDPASPNFMRWSIGVPMPNCANPERTFMGQFGMTQVFAIMMGRLNVDLSVTDNSCRALNTTPVFTDADFNDWREVTIRAPKPGEAPTRYFDVASLRAAKELVLSVPRLGFFSTPAFFANWSTNASNEYRVTVNQTLIVALGQSFDGIDTTIAVSETALDKEHAAPGTVCYACHQTLDPMRQLLRQSFSLFYHEQTDPKIIAQPGVFAFDGVSRVANGADDLARGLADHPRFAAAWTQKLCFFAASAGCAETDPEFVRIADAFRASKHNWKTLVRELFSSPLVTGATQTKSYDMRGSPVSVARRDHLCATLEHRLGLSDPCGISGLPELTAAQNAVGVIVNGLPSDGYSRGAQNPVLSLDTSLFFRAGTENICRRLADRVVDAPVTPAAPGPSRYASANPKAAITDFVHTLMGLAPGDPRAAPARQILDEHYQSAMQTTGTSARDALKSTFVLACTAPSVVSVGL